MVIKKEGDEETLIYNMTSNRPICLIDVYGFLCDDFSN